MSEWKEIEVGQFVDILSSKRIFAADYVPSGIPFYRSKEVIERALGQEISNPLFITEERFHDIKSKFGSPVDGDILLSAVGERAGIPYLVNNEGDFYFKDGNLIWFRKFSNELDSEYLVYYLNSRVGQFLLENLMIGSAQRALTIIGLKGLVISVPDIENQKEIAKTLSSLDQKITLLRQQNQDLEELAQTLFKRWFVEFEFPNENGEPYKSSGGKMVESELGEIPEGWRVGVLSDIADITIGRTPPRKEPQWFSSNKEDVKWISIKDMGESGVFITNTSEYLTRDAVQNFRVPVIPKNTTILSFKLTVGRVAITTEDMLSNEAIAHIHMNKNYDCFQFSYLLLKSYNYDKLGNTSSIATAVNSNSIKNMEVLIPTSENVKSFDNHTVSIFNKLRNNTEEIQTLTQLRDTLLPKLMSGELNIKLE